MVGSPTHISTLSSSLFPPLGQSPYFDTAWRNQPGGYLREILTAKVYDAVVRGGGVGCFRVGCLRVRCLRVWCSAILRPADGSRSLGPQLCQDELPGWVAV